MIEPAGEWLLGERFFVRTLDQYRRAFGGFSALFEHCGLPFRSTNPDVMARELPVLDLARLNGRAIVELAAQEGRAAGREPLRHGDWQVISYVLSSARTLREAIERCAECFRAIDWRCGKMTLHSIGDAARIELNAQRAQVSDASLLIDLHGIARIHALLSSLVAQPLPIQGIFCNHPGERFAALSLPPFPYPLHLDTGWTGFSFPLVYLDHPVVRTLNELGKRPYDSFLFNTLVLREGDETISLQVRRIALRSLRDQHVLPSFEDVVETLGGSPATLRRRLARTGTSYRDIRDSCRREVALDLLSHSRASIEEIATRLDFCDSDAFRRTFRDWFGEPPSTYRQRLQGASVDQEAHTA